MTPLLQAAGVAIDGRLRPTEILVPAGQLVAIVGPNGGGKTSLLRAIAGIERTSGEVLVAGEDVDSAGPARRPSLLGFLPASRELVWPLSVRDVIALGLPRPEPERVDQLMDLLELMPLAERQSDRLSTGERARVLFARAVAARPKLLLLDEPLSNLDPYWVLRLLDILREVVASGTSALVALHDIDRVAAFDRVLLVAEGGVRADLPPGDMLGDGALAAAFRIEWSAGGWRVRRPAGRRSSP